MNGNDTLGDCVEAGFNHIDGVWTGNAGAIYVAPLASIISEYSAIGGYVPGNPNTDNGSDEITAVNYYMKTGFSNGDKIIGYLALDATNKTELQLAIYLFENIIYGIELPDAWITPFPSANGFIWDVAGRRTRQRSLSGWRRLQRGWRRDLHLGHDRDHDLGRQRQVRRLQCQRERLRLHQPGSVDQGPGQGSKRLQLGTAHRLLRRDGWYGPAHRADSDAHADADSHAAADADSHAAAAPAPDADSAAAPAGPSRHHHRHGEPHRLGAGRVQLSCRSPDLRSSTTPAANRSVSPRAGPTVQ